MKTHQNFWLCHVALWFPLLFATPLFIALNNRDDVQLTLVNLSVYLVLATGLAVLVTQTLTRVLGPVWQRRLSLLALALAIVLVIQGNIIHERFYYGEFDGQAVTWRSYGLWFWMELVVFSLALPVAFVGLLKTKRPPVVIPLILIASSALLVAPSVLSVATSSDVIVDNVDTTDQQVFEFSRERNLIHLLPDGLQGDIARETLQAHPELAAAFAGFTMFNNHVGSFQTTAPTVSTIFNGRPYDLSQVHTPQRVQEGIAKYAYQNHLAENGYRTDYVVSGSRYCPEHADSCLVGSFSGQRPRGYFKHTHPGTLDALAVVADLSLFRHIPMFLKEHVYNDGKWFLSDSSDDPFPYPDPVMREWIDNIVVRDEGSVYKWYHYIGTHVPPQWNADCKPVPRLERIRENYTQQAFCVLTGIANLINKLKALGLYDNTAIVISGDHGSQLPAIDQTGEAANSAIYKPWLMGHARPTFMVKPPGAGHPLEFSDAPTLMVDVAPTALDLVGLSGDFEGQSALELQDGVQRTRTFRRVDMRTYWAGGKIAYNEFHIDGHVRDASNWQLVGIQVAEDAPSGYPRLKRAEVETFTRGLGFAKDDSGQRYSWVRGKEFAFLVSSPEEFTRLVMSLHIPESIGDQIVSLSVNGKPVVENYSIERSGSFWEDVTWLVDSDLFDRESNFIRIVFSGIGTDPKKKSRETSALIKTIELL